jgi:hypothetical protein
MTFEEIQKEFLNKEIALVAHTSPAPSGSGDMITIYNVEESDVVHIGLANALKSLGLNLVLLFPNEMMTMDLDMSRVVARVQNIDGKFLITSIRNG